MAEMRIHKAMADMGYASRRESERLVQMGRVTVNGRPAKVGMSIDPAKVLIAVDGNQIAYNPKAHKRYILLNKPRGYVTTAKDELGRKTVMDLIPDVHERVYPVGRLDKVSEGLIILTNDGELAFAVTHPSSHVEKKYRVTITPDIDDQKLIQLSEGVVIDGVKTAPAIIRVVAKEPGRVVLEMTIYEGRNRQIRKMCEAVGVNISRLKRLSIGPIKLGMIQPGEYREMTTTELRGLKNLTNKARNRVEQEKKKGTGKRNNRRRR